MGTNNAWEGKSETFFYCSNCRVNKDTCYNDYIDFLHNNLLFTQIGSSITPIVYKI